MTKEQDFQEHGFNNNVDINAWKKLTDVQHVLERPQIYIGAMQFVDGQQIERYNPDNDRPIERDWDAILCPGLNTMFNELINNSYDERVRQIDKGYGKNALNRISVHVNAKEGKIAVWDNGGVPVVYHDTYQEWLPQMLFGSLRSGSNFSDKRGAVSGTNGVGSSLVNVMSKQFKVITALNGTQFEMTWSNNMSEHTEAKITKCSKKDHFTYIEAYIDMSRWELDGEPMTRFNHDTVEKWLSRTIEVAVMGCDQINPLEVEWHNETPGEKIELKWSFKHFWEYKDLWVGTEDFRGDENENYAFEIGPSHWATTTTHGIVNSIRCDYGTHMNFIANVCADYIGEYVKDKHKIDIMSERNWKQKYVFSRLMILSMWKIPNPEFDQQTKSTLETKTDRFGFPIIISDKLKKHLAKTSIVQDILDEYQVKQDTEKIKRERQEQKEMNEKLTVKTKQFYVDKLVDASKKGDRSDCELFIVEGDSASTGLRNTRDGYRQGFYCLRGKSIGNTYYDNEKKLINKPELVGLMQSIGLKFGVHAKPSSLRYGKISILTDADVDGDSICAMISLFFLKFWPELYDYGIIHHVMTPLVVATNTKSGEKLYFYTSNEFSKHEQELTEAKWFIDYKKGLAALTDEEFEDMMHEPMYEKFHATNDSWSAFDAWFGGDANGRKALMGFENI